MQIFVRNCISAGEYAISDTVGTRALLWGYKTNPYNGEVNDCYAVPHSTMNTLFYTTESVTGPSGNCTDDNIKSTVAETYAAAAANAAFSNWTWAQDNTILIPASLQFVVR